MNNDTIPSVEENHDHLRANDERAQSQHEERLTRQRASDAWAVALHRSALDRLAAKVAKEERAELVRHKVRELAAPFFDSQQNGGLPLDELLWGLLKFCGGTLARMTLDEPASLKIRRLGREMDHDPIAF